MNMSWQCPRIDQVGFGAGDPFMQSSHIIPRAAVEMQQSLEQQHFLSSATTREQEELLRRKAEHMESLDIAPQHRYAPPTFAGRTSRLTDKALREHFHLPLSDVAKKFGMCTTAFKKLCRKQGVMQWPQRTLRSLEKKIASLHAEQKFTNDQNHIEDQIRKLQAKRESILSGNCLANLEFDETLGASPSDDSSANSACSGGSSPRAADVMGQLALDDSSSTASSSSLADERARRSSHGDVRDFGGGGGKDGGYDYKDHVEYGGFDRVAAGGAMRRVRSLGGFGPAAMAAAERGGGGVSEMMFLGPPHVNPRFGGAGGLPAQHRAQLEAAGLGYADQRRNPPFVGQAGGYWIGDSGDFYGAAAAHEAVRPQMQGLLMENSSLRNVIRSLAKERDDWMMKFEAAQTELSSLRLVCHQLEGQLGMQNMTASRRDGEGGPVLRAKEEVASHGGHSSCGGGSNNGNGSSSGNGGGGGGGAPGSPQFGGHELDGGPYDMRLGMSCDPFSPPVGSPPQH